MNRSTAEIVREYGPFPGVDHVHGVTYDGQHVWFAAGDTLNAFDPTSGKTVGWAHSYGRSRVVYIQPGHGPDIFAHPSYRKLMTQAIRWAAAPPDSRAPTD